MSHARFRKSLCPRILANSFCRDSDSSTSGDKGIRSPGYVPVLGSVMSRVRHCVECPKCHTRYLPSFSPYRNGSYLIPLTAHGATGWILYCSCRMPPASSQWSSTDLKPYEICRQAYRRGYGSAEEVWDVTRV